MSPTSIHPLPGAKATLMGFLVVAGIIGALGLIPWAVMILLLWIAGFQIQALLVFLLFIICCMIVGSGLMLGRPGKGLPAGFGG